LPVLSSLALLGLAHLVFRNFDRSVIVDAAAAILLPLAFGFPWTLSAYALPLFCLTWARKLQDRRHQQRVWSSTGWLGVAHSDWYDDTRSEKQAEPGAVSNEHEDTQ
jgi:hypothetical protein